MERDWREEVAPDQRKQLIDDLAVEKSRVSENQDAQKVRDSVVKFELMIWSSSVNHAAYLAKMTRKLANMKRRPSYQQTTESQTPRTPVNFFLDDSAAAADPVYTARVQGMKLKYVDGGLTLILDELERETAQQWASVELRTEISRLELIVASIITLLESAGRQDASRVAVDRVEDFIQHHLLPIRQRLEESKARAPSLRRLVGASQLKADDQIRRVVEAHAELWVGTLRGQRVAIKRLASGDYNKANALAFASEIKLMSQLQHPKIAAFLGVEWTKEWQALAVTEFVSGGDLRSFLDSQQQQQQELKSQWFTWADFKCQVAIDVVDALAYLHSRNEPVCMQTLKARHVLLDAKTTYVSSYVGGAKLSLYAVARLRSVLNVVGADESSLRWLAPELATGDATWTDRATIYSFGVLLSELDTARLPYYDAVNLDGSAMSSFKILQLVTKGELSVSLSEDCSEAIATVVRQCMARDPLQRPSAAQLAFTLRDILKNEL